MYTSTPYLLPSVAPYVEVSVTGTPQRLRTVAPVAPVDWLELLGRMAWHKAPPLELQPVLYSSSWHQPGNPGVLVPPHADNTNGRAPPHNHQVFGDKTELLIDREAEKRTLLLLNQQGFGAQVCACAMGMRC